jgi:hypothetical protein
VKGSEGMERAGRAEAGAMRRAGKCILNVGI